MFRMLSNQHYPHRANQKLRSWANVVFQNRGVCGQAVPSFPSPSPVIHFFLLLSQLSRRTSRGNACYAGYTFLKIKLADSWPADVGDDARNTSEVMKSKKGSPLDYSTWSRLDGIRHKIERKSCQTHFSQTHG